MSSLVTNKKSSLYGGVSQQSSEYRNETQVEECINATPTVAQGLLKRNPTSKLTLSSEITYDDNMFIYSYDRGLSGNDEEKYSVQITSNGLEIINIISGKVYSKSAGGLILEDSSEDYISEFVNARSFSAVTIQDTTFIANKNVQPKLDPFTSGGGNNETGKIPIFQETIWFKPSARSYVDATSGKTIKMNSFSPTNLYSHNDGSYQIEANAYIWTSGNITNYIIKGSTTTITIDGTPVSYNISLGSHRPNTINPITGIEGSRIMKSPQVFVSSEEIRHVIEWSSGYWETSWWHPPIWVPPVPYIRREKRVNTAYSTDHMTHNEYIVNMKNVISSTLSSSLYSVSIVNGANGQRGIRIERNDGIQVNVSGLVVMEPLNSGEEDRQYSTIVGSISNDYIDRVDGSSREVLVTFPKSVYQQEGFYWVKASEPTVGYSYSYSISSSTNTAGFNGTVTSKTSEGAATLLAQAINAHSGFTAFSNGSIVKAFTSDEADLINFSSSDSFGGLASFSWAGEVNSALDLPKTLPVSQAIVHVIGDNITGFKGYWLEYEDGAWKETLGFNTQPKILSSTMPHLLVRNTDDTFTMKEYDKWSDKEVGDDDTNKPPTFTTNGNVIKDMFFFKNRLGFITDRTVILSEVGEYGNFWRTTVSTVLDSDRIDTTVDTTRSIQLEYATYLEDSLMLFSDKAQFKLEGGKILSPTSIQISQTSSYTINKNIRPLFVDDKIFFCSTRGDYTALMQYSVDGNGRVSEAIDLTSHVEYYVPNDITRMSSSPVNNMLFFVSPSVSDTIFVYKYLDNGNERVQSAWFKYTYNGRVYGAFSLGRNLNILIKRVQSSAVENWVLGSGIWNGDKAWTDNGIWHGNEDDLTSSDNFEVQAIHPQPYDSYFVDDSRTEDIDGTISSLLSISALNEPAEIVSDIKLTKDTVVTSISVKDINITVELSDGSTLSGVNSVTVNRNPALSIVKVSAVSDIHNTFSGFNIVQGFSENLLYNGTFLHGHNRWTIPLSTWEVVKRKEDKGSIIPVDVSLGEFTLKKGDKALTSGSVKLKSIRVNSEDDSDFFVQVDDIARRSTRKIPSSHTIGRNPMIYGDNRNIRLHIKNGTTKGFRINSIDIEASFNSRSRRI